MLIFKTFLYRSNWNYLKHQSLPKYIQKKVTDTKKAGKWERIGKRPFRTVHTETEVAIVVISYSKQSSRRSEIYCLAIESVRTKMDFYWLLDMLPEIKTRYIEAYYKAKLLDILLNQVRLLWDLRDFSKFKLSDICSYSKYKTKRLARKMSSFEFRRI